MVWVKALAKKAWAVMKLIMLFVVELIKANIHMVKIVLQRKLRHQSGIVAFETRLTKPIEITLLAALISLTPGTVSMDFSQDGQTIFIHAIDVPDKDALIVSIRQSFERAIMEVTRPCSK